MRRKLAALGRRGWIEPAPGGGWRLTLEADDQAPAQRELEGITAETNLRLARLVEQLVRIGLPAD